MNLHGEKMTCVNLIKNDILNNYSAKSKGDTYQKIDGFDGIDADVVRLRVLNIHKGKKEMIFEYGSVPIRKILSKVLIFEGGKGRTPFSLSETCNEIFTFTPISVDEK